MVQRSGSLCGYECRGAALLGRMAAFIWQSGSRAAEAWATFLEGPLEEARQNAARRAVPYNRVVGWAMPLVTVAVGGPPG